VTLANVAILHTRLSWEVLAVLIVAWALANWDAVSIKVHNGTLWTSATLNTLLSAGILELKSTT